MQLLDDIYDKYLAELPDDIFQALKKAEDTKVLLISELFAQRILEYEESRAEIEEDDEKMQAIT